MGNNAFDEVLMAKDQLMLGESFFNTKKVENQSKTAKVCNLRINNRNNNSTEDGDKKL